ncbi:MAG: TetR/AcrR family transcriptional regulator [Pseudarthrobacter sp.]|nr:TetR/AcrR family transcriptional regulator [Pseudarthrobacter sp.]
MSRRHNEKYAETGRTRQKSRTREALVAVLRDLLKDGQDPSVAEVATVAGISRTTAYRYFPDKEALLHAALPETGAGSLLGEDPPSDVRDRLARTLDAHFDFIRTWDPQLRAALRLSLTPGAARPTLRGGRAVAWYRDALAPLDAAGTGIDTSDLAVRLRAVAGVEPYVWLRDVAGLSRDAAFGVMRANALDILDAALASRK